MPSRAASEHHRGPGEHAGGAGPLAATRECLRDELRRDEREHGAGGEAEGDGQERLDLLHQ